MIVPVATDAPPKSDTDLAADISAGLMALALLVEEHPDLAPILHGATSGLATAVPATEGHHAADLLAAAVGGGASRWKPVASGNGFHRRAVSWGAGAVRLLVSVDHGEAGI